MSPSENRRHQRVQFFLVPLGTHEIRPVWVFNSPDHADALPALLVNLSNGGLQVLTELESEMPSGQYQLSFLPDEAQPDMTLADCYIQLLWTEREAGMHTRSGFAFVEQMPADLQDLLTHEDAAKLFLRCVIMPVNEVQQSGLEIV
ncbi:hypothetical protein ACO0LC_25935 [Undibacterium sp. JH2W]|uniref:hypothetical protein n=1 Tax=Undibacterium sp. JH2W TaxID=3413037 RepID=UPI003BF088B0